MALIDETVSEQFLRWERAGRGWQVWPFPVSPEPPFRPFPGYRFPDTPVADDGRRPTFFSSVIRMLSEVVAAPPAPVELETDEPEPEPEILEREELTELQISLPSKFSADPRQFSPILTQLALCREPVSFEILGTAENIRVQFAAHPHDARFLERQLKAYLPEVVTTEATNVLQSAWQATDESETLIVEFGLGREFAYPLAKLDGEPFIGMIAPLAELAAGECGLFQIIFRPVENLWAESLLRAVSDPNGRAFFVNTPELTRLAQDKVGTPLFAAVVRMAIRAPDFDRVLEIARDMAGALRLFARIDGNELIPLCNDQYPFDAHVGDVLNRQCRRSGMILNTEELLGFVHLPGDEVRSPKLCRELARTKAVPAAFAQAERGLLLGQNLHAGRVANVRLNTEERCRHVHVIGASGTGKSTFLFNLIRQDILNGEGVAVLDPHGDLVEKILEVIPPERVGDVVLLDPADETHSVGFNILSAHSDLEKTLLASDLVSVFQRLSTSWGDQMGSVLQNAIHAFLESSQGGTLSDLRRFLIEPAFRNRFLTTVRDPDILYYWKKGFAQLTGNRSIGPVLTRLETFLSPKPIRYMVSQRENKLDFAHIMDNRKIFLAKLAQGQIGKENAFLLGSLFVAKFQETAMSRQAQSASTRQPFWLYIDEFHNFITPSMAEILTGARKYRLGLILAHQELRQLQRETEVASAVLSNAFSRVCFRLGDDDARKLADGFAFFEARDLQNLDRGQAICRLERSDCDFNLSIPYAEGSDGETAAIRRNEVITASRVKYGKPKSEVEAELLRQLGLVEDEPKEERKVTEVPKRSQPEQKPEIVPTPEPPKAEVMLVVPPPTPKPSAPPETPKPSLPPADMGRGGAQHQAIQRRIKEAAEKIGFLSVIEKSVLDGLGSVDLWLERADQAFACEVSISTTIDHEVGNVAKCLKAGIQTVAVICLDEERLRKIRVAVAGSLGTEQAVGVEYFLPDQFIAHLEKLPAPPAKDAPTVRRGYKVKRSAPALTVEERQQRENVANKMMAEAMRRKR